LSVLKKTNTLHVRVAT